MKGPRSGRCSTPSTTSPKSRVSAARTGARSARYSRGAAAEGHTAGGFAVAAVGRAISGFIARSSGTRETVTRDSRIVLADGRREMVAMIVAGDEVEVLHGRRIEDGLDGREPGARDRAGRQPRAYVGVVGMVGRQIGTRERASLLAHGVLHRGVGLEQHADLQPV